MTKTNIDTIAALATPAGNGGIGIIRISGPQAWKIGFNIFKPRNNKIKLDLKNTPRRTLILGQIINPNNTEEIDEILCTFFKNPYSYTTEDTIELQGHGGQVVLNRILKIVLNQNCRLAQPGEFTLRAFLGGRIDLSQAIAVAELIAARSQNEARLALAGLRGGLSKRLKLIRKSLLNVVANLEATLDFPEDLENIDGANLAKKLLTSVSTPLHMILNEQHTRGIFKEGACVVLCGRPNVGKSSLFNAILGRTRALVSPLAGTTRDYLEETTIFGGVATRLIDTAGLNPNIKNNKKNLTLEKLGENLTEEQINQADLCVVVLDISETISNEDQQILQRTKSKPQLLIANKADLKPIWDLNHIKLTSKTILKVSAQKKIGIKQICLAIGKMLNKGELEPKPGEIIVSARQAESFTKALQKTKEAAKILKNNNPAIELATIELTQTLNILGEIDGHNISEEIIETIFSSFCLGK